jgi:3-oxoacyl-[acyl-carrier protein] reductase
MKLQNKTVLVTGSSRGIGRAIAELMAAEGATVVVHSRQSGSDAEAVVRGIQAKEGRAFAVSADLTEVESLEPLFASIRAGLAQLGLPPRLDVVFNNAGINIPAPFLETTPSQFDALFHLNVRGLFFVTQHAVKLMPAGGKVVNLSSAVVHAAFENIAAYSATKGAVDVLTRHLAAHLGPRGITVNSLSPGATDTDMNASWLRENEQGAEAVKSMQALQRVGMPSDIARVALFLATSDSDWVTGQVLEASGGWKL